MNSIDKKQLEKHLKESDCDNNTEKIRELKNVNLKDSNLFKDCVRNSIKNITSWNTESEYQIRKIKLFYVRTKNFII